MPLAAGDIIKVMLHAAKKPKILICICPQKYRFMVINTDPYAFAMAAQLKVTKRELNCLTHDSHIDTSKLLTLQKMETEGVVEANPKCLIGKLSQSVAAQIQALVIQHGIMTKDQMGVVADNIGPLATP